MHGSMVTMARQRDSSALAPAARSAAASRFSASLRSGSKTNERTISPTKSAQPPAIFHAQPNHSGIPLRGGGSGSRRGGGSGFGGSGGGFGLRASSSSAF